MLGFAPDYDHLPLIAKVEVFEYALQNTEGNDLARVRYLPILLTVYSSLHFIVLHLEFSYLKAWFLVGSLVEKSHF